MRSFLTNLLLIFTMASTIGMLTAKATVPRFYCPSSITCDTQVCKPNSGQDMWDNNTTLPPGTKPGVYKFIHAEWYAGQPNRSLCNYYDGTEYGIYIKAKIQLWAQTFAENSAWWPQVDSFAYCYPNDLGNSVRCPYINVSPWGSSGSKNKR